MSDTERALAFLQQARDATPFGTIGGLNKLPYMLTDAVVALMVAFAEQECKRPEADYAALRAEVQKTLACTAHVKMGKTLAEVTDETIRANDEIMDLREENTALREALKPFADEVNQEWTLGDCRRAAALLSPPQPQPQPEPS